MTEKLPNLNKLLRKWRPRLRLMDWDIQIRYVRKGEIASHEQGCVKMMGVNRVARISVLHPADYSHTLDVPQDIENTVVHELSHLPLTLFFHDKEGCRAEWMLMEQYVKLVANAMVALDRGHAAWDAFGRPLDALGRLTPVPGGR